MTAFRDSLVVSQIDSMGVLHALDRPGCRVALCVVVRQRGLALHGFTASEAIPRGCAPVRGRAPLSRLRGIHRPARGFRSRGNVPESEVLSRQCDRRSPAGIDNQVPAAAKIVWNMTLDRSKAAKRSASAALAA